ncbi:MAG: hypothetical protein U9N61_04785 [Euryarchaeota archaeon]|nr:hypothetical protein [Euryarchaeota archaeon]
MKHLKTLLLTLKSDPLEKEDAAKLRSFFATKFREHALLHQHMDVDKLIYRYPRIPYCSTAPRLYLAQKKVRDF